MLENFVKGYFKSNKPLIGLSITPEGMIEAVRYDIKSNTVTAYERFEMEFNPIKKMVDVEDNDTLSEGLEKMIEKLDVPKGTEVVLNLPNFYFGLMDVDPTTQVEEDIVINIKSEVEQSYMFKQNVPLISIKPTRYNFSQRPKVAFCAAQKSVISELKNILSSLDLKVVSIENSNATMLKALQHFDKISEEVASDAPWGVIFINQNSYSIFSFIGDNLIDATEDAIAIRTYEKSEVNYAVASVINSALQNFDFSSVVVVNNSSDVTAKELPEKIEHSNVKVVENNGSQAEEKLFRVNPKISPSIASKISLFVVGATISSQQRDFLFDFDLKGIDEEDEEEGMEEDTLFGVPVEWNTENCIKAFALFALMAAIPLGTIYFGAHSVNTAMTKQIEKLNGDISSVNNEIKQYEIPKEEVITFDPYEEINKIMKSNLYSKTSYNALAVNTPKSTWLTYFYVNKDNATIIRGKSQNVNDIYTLFRNIKKNLNNKDLVLSSIKLASDTSNAKKTYEFEITNSEYIRIVELIRDQNSDYKKHIEETKKASTEKYNKSYMPMQPVMESEIDFSGMDNEMSEIESQLQNLQDLDQVGSNTPPKQLPPT